MIRSLVAAAAACLLLQPAVAVFADEAWNLDYHHALVGEPKESTTFFHRPNPESKASLIYTLSEKRVLGAVNPRDGAIVWRQVLQGGPKASNSSFLRAGDGQDLVISGIGNQVAGWSAADGRLAWTHSAPGELADLEILELLDGKDTPSPKDVLIIAGGRHAAVQRLDGTTGALKWEHRLDTGDVAYQVSASATELYAIMLHKTILGYIKIRVIALDPVTGKKTDEYSLSSDSELSSADTIVSVGANSASPIIAWTDSAFTTLKVNIIGTKAVSSFDLDRPGKPTIPGNHPVKRVRAHAPYHTNSLAHFLVHVQTEVSDWAKVLHVDLRKNQIKDAFMLPELEGLSVFSTNTIDAEVFFTRLTARRLEILSSQAPTPLGAWPVVGFGTVGTRDFTHPVHSVAELSVKGDTIQAVRTAVLQSSGEWMLFRDGAAVWQRAEVLADTISAAFALPVQAETLVHELEEEAHSNPVSAYVHRVKRHIQDLQHLPAALQALPQRVVNGFLGLGGDSGEAFGFNKIIVCATESGRLVAIDAASPNKIFWSKQAVQLPAGQTWSVRLEALPDGLIRAVDNVNGESPIFIAANGEKLSPYSQHPPEIENPIPEVAVHYSLRNGELEATTPAQAETGALWHFTPQQGERILGLVPRPVNDPVASIGKVLGDRNVLYKYLNPNLALLTTAHDAAKSASVYVLDTVSGAIVYSNTHKDIDLSSPIASTLSENWFAYSYTAASSASSPKGHHLIVGELFESLTSNDRGLLDDATNVSSLASTAEPFTLTQTYQIPEPISKMSVTQTRQGITSRQLLAVLADSASLIGIPRGLIDPRRPVNRDPTKDEQMEGLTRYAPVIEFDPKWYLNHQREVLGVKDVMTSPAILESTSLVFAYGLDVFGTRLSPSFNFDMLGKDFNKFQMLATVAALAVATFVVAPLVSFWPRASYSWGTCADYNSLGEAEANQREMAVPIGMV